MLLLYCRSVVRAKKTYISPILQVFHVYDAGGWRMVDGGWWMVERQNKSRVKQVETKKSQIFAKVFKLGEMAGGTSSIEMGCQKVKC